MKKIAIITIILSLLFACGEHTAKKVNQETKQSNTSNEESNKLLPSADYSSLFNTYECDMTVAEVAAALNIPESNVHISEYQNPGACSFLVKGFGKNAIGETIMTWGATPFSKADSKKEIQSFLKKKKNNENIFGMDIELSESRDCYITIMPHVGRVIIYNENYDHAFYFNYSQRGIYKRTEEEHEELTKKTITLANYLLKKHRK